MKQEQSSASPPVADLFLVRCHSEYPQSRLLAWRYYSLAVAELRSSRIRGSLGSDKAGLFSCFKMRPKTTATAFLRRHQPAFTWRLSKMMNTSFIAAQR